MSKLRVWWIPQIPGKPFRVPVDSLEEADLVYTVLAEYDLFQLANNIKGDFANVGGLEVWEEDSDGDGNPGWSEWCDEETGEDFSEWRRNISRKRFSEIRDSINNRG